MTDSSATAVLERIKPIMREKGVTLDVREFHHQVNVIFHAWESKHYDSLHTDMVQTLPYVWAELAQDLVAPAGWRPRRVLDVGCGTGLSIELLLQTELGKNIQQIHLLDTSREMLDLAKQRPCLAGRDVTFTEGFLEDLPESNNYDLIMTSSVLHHLVDLAGFCEKVDQLQRTGGVFLHLQDPNGDALNHPELQRRTEELENSTEMRLRKLSRKVSFGRIARVAKRALTGKAEQGYIEGVNQELMSKNIIQGPLTAAQIWSITDLRVNDELGISMAELRGLLPAYHMASHHSYSFFGDLRWNLPSRFRQQDEELAAQHSLAGMHLAGAWKKA